MALKVQQYLLTKIGGPKGVGAMFINSKYKLPSFLHGGKQELERRAGTVDVPGIAAFCDSTARTTDKI